MTTTISLSIDYVIWMLDPNNVEKLNEFEKLWAEAFVELFNKSMDENK